MYRYGTSTAFPTDSYNNTNYWVDVVLATTVANAAPVVSSVSPANSATAVDVAVKPAATFDQAVTASSVVFTVKDAANAAVAGTVGYDSATRTATFTPASALAFSTTYGVTVSGATNATGQTMAPYSWTFTTAAAPSSCPCSVFNPTSVPATLAANDPNAVELGMKFRSDVAGTVTGVRFYKGSCEHRNPHRAFVDGHRDAPGVGDVHGGNGLGLAAGDVLHAGADHGEHHLCGVLLRPERLPTPPTAVTSASAADKAPLHGLASGTDGSNGVYRYGTSTAFPTDSYNNTNYWVDVVVSQ